MDFGLYRVLKQRKREGLNPVIAEIKVHSPKYGDLIGKRDEIEILRVYEKCKVAGISYITEKKHYKGSFETLRKICKHTSLPVLRKDFVTSKGEIERTSEAGASAILLIARILGENTPEFVDFSIEHALDPVVEVHSAEDIRIAIETKTPIIGINNRDISKLEKDDGSVELTAKLSSLIPDSFLKISESGISSLEHLKVALSYADAVLIGTAFMKAKNLEKTVRNFVEAKLC